jgi:hypothetical protein
VTDHKRIAGQVARTGTDVVQARVASFAGMAAAAIGAVFALGGCAIAAILGNGPGFLGFVAIVLGVALVCGLLARTIVRRINMVVLATMIARRASSRGRRRP